MGRLGSVLRNISLVVIGQLASLVVERRLKCYFQEQIDAASLAVSSELTAESIARSSDWSSDAVQAASAVLLPTFGFFLLTEGHLSRWLPATYFGASVVAFVLLLWILSLDDPTTYGRKYRFLRLSLVNLISVALNTSLGIASLLLTP